MPALALDTLYETDLAEWADTQAAALEQHDISSLDWENLAEEIRALSRSDKRAIESHLKNILLHLIKWELQPQLRSISWRLSIRNSREAIRKLVAESPSLRSHPAQVHAEALADAYADALIETGLPDPQPFTPFTIAQVLDQEFMP